MRVKNRVRLQIEKINRNAHRAMRIASVLFAFTSALFLLKATTATQVMEPPATARRPVIDEYYGIRVVDDYRWLENGDDPEVRKWRNEQNEFARRALVALPAHAAFQKRLTELLSAHSANYFGLKYSHVLFALKSQPPREQPLLITLRTANDRSSEHVVVDLNALNPEGTTAIDWYVPSPDGKLVAVSLSQNGSEDGTLHIYEVATSKELNDSIPRVEYPTAEGCAAWSPDGSGFYYTRYPAPGERSREDLHFYQQLYFHKLGTPVSQDVYALGKDFPRIAEIRLRPSQDGRHLLAEVENGDGGEYEHFLRDLKGGWKQLTHFQDKAKVAHLGRDGTVYLLSTKDAPHGKILRLSPDNFGLEGARTIVPEGSSAIEDFLPTEEWLYVQDLVGGPSQIRVFSLEGQEAQAIKLPPISSVQNLISADRDEILFDNESYVQPSEWYRYSPGTSKTERTDLYAVSAVSFKDVEVSREFATSRDGTKIPLNILRLKSSKLNGKNPVILTGYGGFGISLKPQFDVSRYAWLEQGGVYVIANLRAGGEFGEQWHLGGNLTKKQNVFDDFISCASYLIEAKYTEPSRLAIEGESNGGLLMGAVLTQRPDLFRAVVSHVGIYDMLRVELDPNGAFNATEFGSVKNREQFMAMYAYSPYLHVKDGAAYPAILMLTGDNDGRVNPAHSRKMIARLQAATSSKNPILLLTSSISGHGHGTAMSEAIAQQAYSMAFIAAQLGISAGVSN